MLAHIRSVHDKFSQKFYCPVESCGQYFNYKHVLDRHMKNNNHKQVSYIAYSIINTFFLVFNNHFQLFKKFIRYVKSPKTILITVRSNGKNYLDR